METTRTDRVRILLKYYNISIGKFADMLGISQSTLSSQLQRNSITQETIDYILLNYEYVNPYWLLFGKGDMFTDEAMMASIDAKVITDVTNNVKHTREEWAKLNEELGQKSRMIHDDKEDYAGHQQKMIDQLIQLGIDSQARMIRINEIVDKLAGVCEAFAVSITKKECECAELRKEVASVHVLLSEIVRNMCHVEGKQINFHNTNIDNQNI